MHLRRSQTSRIGRIIAGALILSSMTSCALVDSFGSRVDAFNEEAEGSKARVLVLNILRAAYGEPLEFSTLATVLGTASAGGTLGATLPLVRKMPSVSYVFSPSVTASGGPQFTTQFLDTKEFLSGIQAPIPIEAISALNASFPMELILPLLLTNIEFQSPNGTLHRVENTDLDPTKATLFASIVRQLANAGLSTERTTQRVPYGSIIVDNSVALKSYLDAKTAGLELRKYDVSTTYPSSADPLLSRQEFDTLMRQHASVYYRTFTTSSAIRFCFDPLRHSQRRDLIAGKPKLVVAAAPVPPSLNLYEGDPEAVLTIPPSYVCGSTSRPDHARELLQFNTRTVEGVIDYLGEIARLELGLIAGTSPNPAAGPLVWVGNTKARLFTIMRGSLGQPGVHVSRGLGEQYVVPLDETRSDLSGTVLRIVSELIILNSSVKDLPASSAIPVIAP